MSIHSMTLEEFTKVVRAAEANCKEVPATAIDPKKTNGMSVELSTYLDSLSDPKVMEAEVARLVIDANNTIRKWEISIEQQPVR